MNPEEKQKIATRFANELWPLNRAGNHLLAQSELIHAIEDDMLVGGIPVTFDIILTKYKEYLSFIKSNNSSRDPAFHTKTEDIAGFIMKKKYNEDFIPSSNNEIDTYLYGN